MQKQGDQFRKIYPHEIQPQLANLSDDIKTNEDLIKTTQEAYYCLLLKVNPNYKERGLQMKLNSKRSVSIAGESNTHLRVFTIQTIVFNSYPVAQIKHIGATKPSNWRPWDPKNKTKCCRFDAKDQRSFFYQELFMWFIKRNIGYLFLSGINVIIINLDM